ncbi:MAG: hypothetical protein JNG86_03470, partial [Verrucomicrobiaceae bacterium]|nr:hypothetical protein [Verrucomicrobiaceae bacterium]
MNRHVFENLAFNTVVPQANPVLDCPVCGIGRLLLDEQTLRYQRSFRNLEAERDDPDFEV